MLHAVDLAWGAGPAWPASSASCCSTGSLAAGSMAVVAPITAVTGGLVPLVVGLALGERPSWWRLAGAGCAVVAIGLVSLGPAAGQPGDGAGGRRWRWPPAPCSASSSRCSRRPRPTSGMWPLVAARVDSIPLGPALLLVRRVGAGPARPRAVLAGGRGRRG